MPVRLKCCKSRVLRNNSGLAWNWFWGCFQTRTATNLPQSVKDFPSLPDFESAPSLVSPLGDERQPPALNFNTQQQPATTATLAPVDPMPSQRLDIFTVDELAAYLKVPKSTVYKLAQDGKIPGQKVGRHWRFQREAIDHWISRSSKPRVRARAGA